MFIISKQKNDEITAILERQKVIDMACQGCEARREWIKKQTEIASERLKQLLQ